ncbi:hypothetical protein RvY_16874 [Ramazzottius varieornatus]|uniref:Uncharacterized protein n=1 Tax=Ramazzottius varieornatus TaxID=947166 RepID=A0A1D1W015_RAMVA|nr:hypothetical protein RvY_16874 [Ramazzottius varieornatus]
MRGKDFENVINSSRLNDWMAPTKRFQEALSGEEQKLFHSKDHVHCRGQYSDILVISKRPTSYLWSKDLLR